MSRLTDIAIRVEGSPEPGVIEGGLGLGVSAILSELAGLLEIVAHGGTAATIDLRSLPMSPKDRLALEAAVGEGEVRASLSAQGTSTFQETGISGLWWVRHHDPAGETIAELFEVGPVPQILQATLEEMAASARDLRARLVMVHTGAGSSHAARV
jgi:hydrogenase-1 operon protein HyaF